MSWLASLVHISCACEGKNELHYSSQVELSLAFSAVGWGTDYAGLEWRWVVEHPSVVTPPFKAGRVGTDQMKDGQHPLGRG